MKIINYTQVIEEFLQKFKSKYINLLESEENKEEQFNKFIENIFSSHFEGS